MRKFLMMIAAGLLFGGAALAQTADTYQAASDALVTKANTALTAGSLDDARGLYERALVANPKNLQAYVGLGRVYEGLDRVGRGLRFYRKALEIEPNDVTALRYQGLAFLRRGLIDRANANRDRLARICRDGCNALDDVELAIEDWYATKDDEAEKVASNGTSG